MTPASSDSRGGFSSPRLEAPGDFSPPGAGSAYIAVGLDFADFALLLDDKVSHLRASAMTPGGVRLSNGVLLRIEPDGLGGGGSGRVTSDDYVAEEVEEERTKPEPEDGADEDPAPIRAAETSASETWPTVSAIGERTLEKLEKVAEGLSILTDGGDPSPRLLLMKRRADGLDAGTWQGGERGDPAAAYLFSIAGYAALELLSERSRVGRPAAVESLRVDVAEEVADLDEMARLFHRLASDPKALGRTAKRLGVDPSEVRAKLFEAMLSEPRIPAKPRQAAKAPSAFDYLAERFGTETALLVGAANPLAVCGRRSRFEDRTGEHIDRKRERSEIPDLTPDVEGRAGTRSGSKAHSEAVASAKALAALGAEADYWLGIAEAVRPKNCPACGDYQRRQRREARR